MHKQSQVLRIKHNKRMLWYKTFVHYHRVSISYHNLGMYLVYIVNTLTFTITEYSFISKLVHQSIQILHVHVYSHTMMSIKLILLFIPFFMVSYQQSNSEQLFTVYSKSDHGTIQTSCWKEGQKLPCQELQLILKKGKDLNNRHFDAVKLPSSVHVDSFQQQVDSGNATQECPTWMQYSNQSEQCVCGEDHYNMVKCNATLHETYILDCHQMTYDHELQQVIAGLSFYGCVNVAQLGEIYHPVPANRSQINKAMCSHFFRDGRLCGACRDGYSPLVYSYQLHCKRCSDAESKYNWAVFIPVAFIPLTFFYIFVVLFKFNANSPALHGFVLFAQMFASPIYTRIFTSGWKFGPVVTFLSKLLSTLYGVWNLDYFRILYPDICLRITTLQALTLDYAVAFYPLLLIMITYTLIKLHSREYQPIIWLWKFIERCLLKFKNKEDIQTSMIDVFATFLLLSYNKILSVNFDLLAFTVPVDISGKSVGRYLYYDATYKHFGRDHLPYGILALFSLIICNVLPFLLLLFYPMKWFHRLLNRLKLSHLALHTFVDSFAGCYKDGTEPGTRDCRYFAALFLLIRMLFYVIYQATLTASSYGWGGLLFATYAVLLILAQPYKRIYDKYNKVTTTIFVLMAAIMIALLNANIAMAKEHQAVGISTVTIALLVALPLFYATVIGTNWICKQDALRKLVLRKLVSSAPALQRSSSESSLLAASENRMQNYRSLARR